MPWSAEQVSPVDVGIAEAFVQNITSNFAPTSKVENTTTTGDNSGNGISPVVLVAVVLGFLFIWKK